MPPSLHDLHTALWSTFLNLADVRSFPPETAPMPVSSLLGLLLEVIDGEKKKDPDPQRVRVPRPLLGLAAWNLLLPENVDKEPYEKLVQYVTGLGAREALATYEKSHNPLLFLARQYNILDYRWATSIQKTKIGARLELCVQTPFPHLNGIVFPDQWCQCRFFWAPFKLPPAVGWSKNGSGEQSLTGELRLPGGRRTRAIPVALDIKYQRSGLDSRNEYEITNASIGTCRGVFKVQKELGKPGATRITHEKKIDLGQPPSDEQKAMLAYWLQAETVCLILPA